MKRWNVDDLDRLRAEYADRARRLAGSDRYSPFNAGYLFAIQQRSRAVLTLLRRHGVVDLAGKRMLELGCGRGGVLLEYLSYGATPRLLNGTDLLAERVQDARRLLPHLPLTCADGQQLPFDRWNVDTLER